MTIHAALPGWRESRHDVVIRAASPARLARDERWSDTTMPGWRNFGRPRPIIVSSERGPAFWNNGDGTYSSGAWSLFSMPGVGGLGLEAQISVPADSGQWQVVQLMLNGTLDSVAAEDLHRVDGDGSVPEIEEPLAEYCTANVPAGEGMSQRDSMGVGVGREHRTVPTASIRRGWHRIRLQVLPDGRCGIALDGRSIWISSARLDLGRRFRAVILGNSAWTRVLVGPLQVWEGVRTDVDWMRIGHPPAAGSPRASPRAP